ELSEFALPGELTFVSAAISYMNAGGKRRPLTPLLKYFEHKPLKQIDQAAIDAAAATLMPRATAATRNREICTPISAVLTGIPFYRRARRTKLFAPADIKRIYEALPCPSSSFRRAKAGRRSSVSEAPTSESTLTGALRLASEGKPPRCWLSGSAR